MATKRWPRLVGGQDVISASKAPSVALLAAFAAGRGVPAKMSLPNTGLEADGLTRLELVACAEHELTGYRNILDALGDPAGLGIAAGVRYHVTTHGMWGYA